MNEIVNQVRKRLGGIVDVFLRFGRNRSVLVDVFFDKTAHELFRWFDQYRLFRRLFRQDRLRVVSLVSPIQVISSFFGQDRYIVSSLWPR